MAARFQIEHGKQGDVQNCPRWAFWVGWLGAARDLWLTVTLGCICGGILGNLYDRMGFGFVARYGETHMYHVRDWIHFRLQGVPLFDPWPNFNIADSLLVTGAIMLFVFAIFVPDPNSATSDDSATSGD